MPIKKNHSQLKKKKKKFRKKFRIFFYEDKSGFYRCQSCDELGAHMSTLKCQNCPQGLIMPDCDISNEEASEKYYNCNTCDTKLKCKQKLHFVTQFNFQ